MTITRLRQAGADHGGGDAQSEKAEWDYVTTAGSIYPDAAPVTARTGTYSYYINVRYGRYGGWKVPATRQIRMACSMLANTTDWGNLATGNILVLSDGAEVPILEVGWSASSEKTTGNINIRFNSSWQGASTSNPLFIQRWQNWALDVNIDSSAGWAKLYIDGNEVLSYTGTNTGNVDIERAYFGPKGVSPLGVPWATGTRSTNWDDCYLDDTTGESVPTIAPPALRFYWVSPNANGNYSQWDGSDGDSTDNYALVDEVPTVLTDYVETGVADELDSYNMSTFTLSSGQTIDAVIPWILAKRYNSTEQLALGTRLSSTDLVGSDQAPITDWKAYMERQTTKPGGGSWAQADLDAFEVILKSRGTY